jgi:hypothetical protein
MTSPNYISYKDSAARVVQKDGLFYRLLFKEYQLEYDHLMQSGLYAKLQLKGLLIAHEEVPNSTVTNHDQSVYKTLKPAQIQFQSYPFEWSYTQWKKAILAFFQINQIALEYGMILKDATPFNFYLEEGKAVMLDTSSFEFFKEGDKWNAYRQFCSEFLSPITLMHYNGQRWSRISRTHLRGLPLDFVSKQLPLKSWFNLNTLLHIHIHSKYANEKNNITNKKNAGFSVEKLKSLIDLMQSNLKNWSKPYQFEKHWSEYYSKNIDSEQYLAHKEQVITKWLKQIQPTTVLDMGANTGKFSMLAANYAQKVIALESDDICVDIVEQQIQANKQKEIYTLVIDLAETTPNLGALNKEFTSIYTRAKSQMIMGLAIVHHLHITSQLSFQQIAELFAMFSTQYLIVEFIPITDNKVQFLIKDKKINLMDYNEIQFQKALSNWFTIKESMGLKETDRTLYLLEKKN